MDILEIIKKRRIELNMTQREISSLLGMSINTWQKIESKTQDLKLDVFLKVISILNIPITMFSNKDLIVISKEDLNKIKDATELLTEVTKKLNSQQININDNHGNISFGSGDNVINNYKKEDN